MCVIQRKYKNYRTKNVEKKSPSFENAAIYKHKYDCFKFNIDKTHNDF
jgi:hypothetical protein